MEDKMTTITRPIAGLLFLAALSLSTAVSADGIVNKVVNSPLSATGLVSGARVGINIYLQSKEAPGIEFMNPHVVGYGISPGGRIEVEMGKGFERDPKIPLAQKTIMVVTGAPQQGMPGKAVGYVVGEGGNAATITITPTGDKGLPADKLMSPAPGAKGDPVRQRGIKVFHVGLVQSAFVNAGSSGTVHVRFIDGSGKVVHRGSASIDFLKYAVPQIQPNNFPDRQRNHNWQAIKGGETLGVTPGTLPLPLMLYAKARGVAPAEMVKFKDGTSGVGVLSTQQLMAMEYKKPAQLARYNGGLIVEDSNGDWQLDPKTDRIIGGVIGKAPNGAKGQELRSLVTHGAVDLSKPSSAYHPKFGKLFGGSVMLLQFTAGNKKGLYRPTLALLADPDDMGSGDGSSYTYTIVVE
jgi:hypothetical protein